ncbi:MAG: arylsulfotransferase family protein, partial [Candidatus Binatia bacterium]
SWPGYNLYAPRAICGADLIDLRGRLVHSWRPKPCGKWGQADLLPDGSLLVVGSSAGKRLVMKLDWHSELVWKRSLDFHHDVELTPSGRVLSLLMRNREAPVDGAMQTIRDDLLALLDDRGNLLETVSLMDVLGADPAQQVIRPTRARTRRALDYFHANSIEWMRRDELFGTAPLYGPDNVLVSMRNQDIVAIVDWRRRHLVWWWGRGELMGPHDATLLDNGNILIFDNGLGRDWSRIVEVDPRTNRIAWQYRADPPQAFHTAALGGAQRLPNGNTLFANSYSGEVFEVTSDGQVVWKFVTPYKNKTNHRAAIIRMKRYPAEMIEPLLAAHAER